MESLHHATASPDETARAGAALGRVLAPGDVVALDGELGAGKTCFAEGIARGLGVAADERIASPSFTLVNEHSGRIRLFHIDLYRLERADELDEIGFFDYLDGGGVAVVEWFDRFADLKPGERLDIRIEITGPESRRIHAAAFGDAARARLAAWQTEMERT